MYRSVATDCTNAFVHERLPVLAWSHLHVCVHVAHVSTYTAA